MYLKFLEKKSLSRTSFGLRFQKNRTKISQKSTDLYGKCILGHKVYNLIYFIAMMLVNTFLKLVNRSNEHDVFNEAKPTHNETYEFFGKKLNAI